MVDAAWEVELCTQLGATRVGVIDSRRLAYRVLTVLRVDPTTLDDVNELDDRCRELIAANPELCLIEHDIDNDEFEV